MAGKIVGAIGVRVMPMFDGFRQKVRVYMQAVERDYKRNPVKIAVAANVDRASFVRAKAEAQALAGDVTSAVKGQADRASAHNAVRQLRTAVASQGPIYQRIRTLVDDSALRETKEALSRERQSMKVDFIVDRDRLAKSIEHSREQIRKSFDRERKIQLEIEFDKRSAKNANDRLRRWLKREVDISLDSKAFERQLKAFEKRYSGRKLDVVFEGDFDDLYEGLNRSKAMLGELQDLEKSRAEGNRDTLAREDELRKQMYEDELDRKRKEIEADRRVAREKQSSLSNFDKMRQRFRTNETSDMHKMQRLRRGYAAELRKLQDAYYKNYQSVVDKMFPSRPLVLRARFDRQSQDVFDRLKKLDFEGQTIYRHVGVVFKEGTLDGLKNTFYKKFPDLKPWVWPQLAPDGFKLLREQIAHFGASKAATIRSKVQPVLDRPAIRKVLAQAKSKVLTSKIYQNIHYRLAPGALTKVQAQRRRMLAQAKRPITWTIRAVTRFPKDVYQFYRLSGLRSVTRWKIQLEITEFMRGMRQIRKMITQTFAVSTVAAFASALGTNLLGVVASVRDGLAAMAPALWPLAGVAGALLAGFGVMAVALQDAGEELAELEAPLGELQQGMSAAFWDEARVPVLENANRLITELKPQLDLLSATMGRFLGHFAQGVGNSADNLGHLLDNTTAGFDILGPTVERFMETFLRVGSVASRFFTRFAGWLDDLSVKFADWANQFTDDELEAWMLAGWEAAKDFGNVLKNLIGIISDMATLAAGSHDDMAGFNDRLLAVRETIASPEFQQGLGGFFDGLREGSREISRALGDIIMKLTEVDSTGLSMGERLGATFEGLMTLIADLGRTLAEVFLQPAVTSGIDKLIAGFEQVRAAMEPILKAQVGTLFDTLGRVGDILGSNADGISRLLDYFLTLANISFENIANVAEALLPAVVRVADELGPPFLELAEFLLPLIVESIEQLLPAFEHFATSAGGPLIDAIQSIAETLVEFSNAVLPGLLTALAVVIPIVAEGLAGAFELGRAAIELIAPVLEAVADTLGGALAWALDTVTSALGFFTGDADSAGGTLSDLSGFLSENEGAAKILAGAVTGLVGVMGGLWATIKIGNGLIKLQTALIKAKRAIMVAWNAVTKVGTAIQKGFNAVMKANPMVKLVVIISAVVAALVWFFTQTEIGQKIWETFTEFLTGAWERLKEVASSVWDAITGFFSGAAETIVAVWDGVVEFFSGLWDTMSELVSGFVDGFITVIEGIVEIWSNAWQTIFDFVVFIWETIVEAVGTAIQWVWDTIESILTSISETWNTIWGAISSFVSTVWETIKTAVKNAIDAVKTTISDVLSAIKATWDSVWETVSSFLSDTWETIKTAVSDAIENVKTTITDVVNTISTTWSEKWGAIKDTVSGIWDEIKALFSGAAESFRATFETIGDAIRQPLETAFNAIKSLWNSTVGSLSFSIPDWVPGIGGKGFSMPQLAEGAVVLSATTALIGEAGPEAVIPLPKLQPMLDAAMRATVRGNISGGTDRSIHVGQLDVHLTGADVRDVRTLAQFVDMMNVEARMRVGVRQ